MKDEITYLFVPANKKIFFSKALACGADAIIFDLEDSVHPSEKASGRKNIIDWFCKIKVKAIPTNIYIRINNPTGDYFPEDLKMLEMLSGSKLKGLVIPKLEHSDTVDKMKRLLPEGLRQLSLIGIIETARGLHHCETLAESGIARMAFGSLDYSLDIDCQPSKDALLYPRSRVVVASRIAGLPSPIDCVTPQLSSSDILVEDSLHGSALGFGAKLCIHPEQVPIISDIFLPSQQKIQWANNVMAQAQENYAFQIAGAMIDLPLIKLATRLLEKDKKATQD